MVMKKLRMIQRFMALYCTANRINMGADDVHARPTPTYVSRFGFGITASAATGCCCGL